MYPKIKILYSNDYDLLSDLCFEHLLFWLKELKIKTKIVRSTQLSISSKKSDLILDICKYFNASHYISGALGKNYLEEKNFYMEKINIEYQNYKHPYYHQLYGEFVANLGIVDFCMNIAQPSIIIGGYK